MYPVGGDTTASARLSVTYRPLLADSVEKVGSTAAGRSGVPAVEVAVSRFKLPLGVSLSFLAQV